VYHLTRRDASKIKLKNARQHKYRCCRRRHRFLSFVLIKTIV
jgi:hypothetical protein